MEMFKTCFLVLFSCLALSSCSQMFTSDYLGHKSLIEMNKNSSDVILDSVTVRSVANEIFSSCVINDANDLAKITKELYALEPTQEERTRVNFGYCDLVFYFKGLKPVRHTMIYTRYTGVVFKSGPENGSVNYRNDGLEKALIDSKRNAVLRDIRMWR